MSKVPRPIVRSRQRFGDDPASVRNAVRLIIVVTVAIVFVGSLAVWVFDHRDFPDYGTALWFVLQTVTTVGYGDVTPTSALGRTVAAAVMITAIGFLAVVTSAITSTFVEAAHRRSGTADEAVRQDRDDQIHGRFDELSQRLERIERHLGIDEAGLANATADRAIDRTPDGTTDRPNG
jgi:voltage-gated potassium channel